MTTITKRRLRFRFQILNGPAKGLSCGGWRVWTHGEDTYVTAKSLGDTWKVSLHNSENGEWWASGVTKENSLRPDTVLPDGLTRDVWRFEPTPFVGGRRVAFVVAVFRHALLPEPPDDQESIIEVADRWDALTMAAIRMTEPGVEPHPNWSLVGGPLPLLSGRNVWVTKSWEEVRPTEPEPVAAGAMIEPVSPKTHDINAPGWLVRGVHIR